MKKLLGALGLVLTLALSYVLIPPAEKAEAQNTTCADRPDGDVSNACANTRFVSNNGGGGGGGCALFTPGTDGCVPASGGDPTLFLRADGTWAAPPGSIPVGGVIPWAGTTVNPGYLLTYGQAISRSTFSALFTAITFAPTINCTIGNPTISVSTGTSDRVPVGAPIEASACFAAGTTVASTGSGTLTLNHNAIASTSTTATILPWGNGDGSTTFNVPNLSGRTVAGRDNMSGSAAGVLTSTYYGAVPDAMNVAGGTQATTLLTVNLPAYTPTGSFTGAPGIVDPGHNHGTNALLNNATSSTGGGAFPVPNPLAASNSIAGTGITATAGTLAFTANAQGGTSTPYSNVMPAITLDYVIKAFDVDATTSNLVVGVSTVTGGSNTNILYDNGGILGEYSLSTANQYNCATAGTIVQPSVVYQAETTTTYGTTTTFDFCTFKNTKVTLTGDITTQTLTNVVAGKAGMITFIQDGSGNHTSVWNSAFKFTGGVAPTLTTTAGAVDILTYACRSATFCGASLLLDVK